MTSTGHFSGSHLSKESDKTHFLYSGRRSKTLVCRLLVRPGTVPLNKYFSVHFGIAADCGIESRWNTVPPTALLSPWAAALGKAHEVSLAVDGGSYLLVRQLPEWDWGAQHSSCRRSSSLHTQARPSGAWMWFTEGGEVQCSADKGELKGGTALRMVHSAGRG